MKLCYQIIDDFIESYDYLRAFLDTAKFTDVNNPIDGFDYPGICQGAPMEIIQYSLVKAVGHANLKHGAIRMSLAGAPQPYEVHADDFMGGEYTVIVYLNRPEHCQGGTSFHRHKATGYERSNEGDEWKVDEGNRGAWEQTFLCPMRSNRALIFDSRLLHRQEPMGFGTDPYNGRMVFVGVF
jgi:hypothetical protein